VAHAPQLEPHLAFTRYRHATADERRLIELRFSLSQSVQRRRKRAHITQAELAERIDVAQGTVSRTERASNRVSFDVAVRCLLALGCTDAEIGHAFDVSRDAHVQRLRDAAARRLYPKPRAPGATAGDLSHAEHRFLAKGATTHPKGPSTDAVL
jgi:transcriptional regulator with XRE-family HTH domain